MSEQTTKILGVGYYKQEKKVTDRLYNMALSQREQRQQIQQEREEELKRKEEEELENECTFAPEVSDIAKALPSRGVSDPFGEDRQARIQELADHAWEEERPTFHPVINDKSNEIIGHSRMSSDQLVERLHQEATEKTERRKELEESAFIELEQEHKKTFRKDPSVVRGFLHRMDSHYVQKKAFMEKVDQEKDTGEWEMDDESGEWVFRQFFAPKVSRAPVGHYNPTKVYTASIQTKETEDTEYQKIKEIKQNANRKYLSRRSEKIVQKIKQRKAQEIFEVLSEDGCIDDQCLSKLNQLTEDEFNLVAPVLRQARKRFAGDPTMSLNSDRSSSAQWWMNQEEFCEELEAEVAHQAKRGTPITSLLL